VVGAATAGAPGNPASAELMEANMRKWFLAIVTVGIAAIPLVADVRSSEAATVYPWCLHLGGRNGAMSCGFVTYAQCMASQQGNSWCGENPHYEPPVAPARRIRRVPS
jgi:hypothetical protein